jgi:hypothetical protein
LQGRRAAVRKVLAPGKWQAEEFEPQNLLMYLDVVHAWNYAIKLTICPTATSLYESPASVPFSRYKNDVLDRVLPAVKKGSRMFSKLPRGMRDFLSWDPLSLQWDTIRRVCDSTRESAETLQCSLQSPDVGMRQAAIERHASRVAECLVSVPHVEIPAWAWVLVATGAGILEEQDVYEAVHIAQTQGPLLYADARRALVVNCISRRAAEIV